MKRHILFLGIACCASFFLAGCGEDELTATPGDEPNYFAIPDDATDPESVIRRDFYKETGINLTFSDTLYKERTGTNELGLPVYRAETIDLNYTLTFADDYRYVLDYISTPTEMEFYAGVLRNILLRIRNEHPYSLLPVHHITRQQYSYGEWEDDYDDPYPVVVSCFNCMAIAVGSKMNEETEKTVGNNVVKYLLQQKQNHPDTDISGFETFSEEWYDADFYETDPEVWRQQGFIQDLTDSWWYPSSNRDLAAFVDAVFEQSREEIETQWAGYERILGKFAWIYNFAEANGYIIE